MENVIIYTRVSTDEQAQKGYSLRNQKSTLERYCLNNDLTILAHFEEDFSAKNFKRPAFSQLLNFSKNNKKRIHKILFTKWDRFSRNIEEAYKMIRTFNSYNIEVSATEQPLDLSQSDSKVILAMYLVIPEVENDKNSERTKSALHKAKLEGCFTGLAPKGYKNQRDENGKSTLAIDHHKAPYIQRAFEMYSQGMYSIQEIRLMLIENNIKISKNGTISMLKNPTYLGKIYIHRNKDCNEQLVEGLHPAIIDQDIFDKVQNNFSEKISITTKEPKEIDKALPLRGHLICPSCNRNLTGSSSKGRTGNSYYYYHCNPPCRVRFKADDVNILFELMLEEIQIKEDIASLYRKIIRKIHGSKTNDIKIQKQSLKRELNKLLERQSSMEDKFLDDLIDVKTYNKAKLRNSKRIQEIKVSISQLNS